jgi:hypothetical protein
VLSYVDPKTATLADGVNVKVWLHSEPLLRRSCQVPGGIHDRILRELVDEYVTVKENELASYVALCFCSLCRNSADVP